MVTVRPSGNVIVRDFAIYSLKFLETDICKIDLSPSQYHHKSIMSTLFAYQEQHVARILQAYTRTNVVVDSSQTGAGKSITALHISTHLVALASTKTHLATQFPTTIVIVCPPTLVDHWKRHCSHELKHEDVVVVSSHGLAKFKPVLPFFLIVDECHEFKNQTKRTGYLKKCIQKARYTLLMSATPIDDERQVEGFKHLLKGNVASKVFKMEFTHSTKVTVDLEHFVLDQESLSTYASGMNFIYSATRGVQHEHEYEPFVPEFFTKGVKQIHAALFDSLVVYLKQKQQENTSTRFVVVLKYQREFDALLEQFPEAKVLNGKTLMADRASIIDSFQDNNVSILAVSDCIGGVGIELDDKIGTHPRHILMLPTTNGINFVQMIGRVQRVGTKSHAKVTVIQPNRVNTYFKTQLNRKRQVISQFNTFPIFREHIFKHHCGLLEIQQFLPVDLLSIVGTFSCTCLQ
jgi:superfamily II DNA or RNA helicase